MKVIYRERTSSDITHQYVLEEQVEEPEVYSCDVKVKVKACRLSQVKHAEDLLGKTSHLHIPVGHEISGVVTDIGPEVTMFSLGDRIAGILPLSCKDSGCAETCVISQYDIVKLPDDVDLADVAAVIGDGVRAYTALHYQAHLCGGDTVLVIDGATSEGSAVIQLAQHWGTKVLATCSTEEERFHLEGLQPAIAQIIDIGDKNNILVSSVMEETGGLGVDVIVDNGVRLFSSEEDIAITGEAYKYATPSKHELISCLGAGGHWVTSHSNLQLDPPDSRMLFLKGGTVSFLFPPVWSLSGAQYGRYQHILKAVIQKISQGIFKPNITAKISIQNAVDVLQTIQNKRVGEIIMQI